MTPLIPRIRLIITNLVCCLLFQFVYGATDTWDGDTDTNFDTAGNWDNGTVPDGTDDVIFTGTAGDYSIVVGSDEIVNTITFDSTADKAYTFTGAGSIEIDYWTTPGIKLLKFWISNWLKKKKIIVSHL